MRFSLLKLLQSPDVRNLGSRACDALNLARDFRQFKCAIVPMHMISKGMIYVPELIVYRVNIIILMFIMIAEFK